MDIAISKLKTGYIIGEWDDKVYSARQAFSTLDDLIAALPGILEPVDSAPPKIEPCAETFQIEIDFETALGDFVLCVEDGLAEEGEALKTLKAEVAGLKGRMNFVEPVELYTLYDEGGDKYTFSSKDWTLRSIRPTSALGVWIEESGDITPEWYSQLGVPVDGEVPASELNSIQPNGAADADPS